MEGPTGHYVSSILTAFSTIHGNSDAKNSFDGKRQSLPVVRYQKMIKLPVAPCREKNKALVSKSKIRDLKSKIKSSPQ